MLLALLLLVSSPTPFAADVQDAYAHQNADALRGLLRDANSQTDSLLVRYRLYPLTEDASLLDDLPSDLPNGSARDLALLSGLWSYRAGESSIFGAIEYGRRSTTLLERAKQKAPNDPYVLLVEGQSLLFRPAIAGRDPSAAADRFETLASRAQAADGVTPMEANVWCWLALREAGKFQRARHLQEKLLSENPPPLYRQFLHDPPEV